MITMAKNRRKKTGPTTGETADGSVIKCLKFTPEEWARLDRFLNRGPDPVSFSSVVRRAVQQLLDREFPEDCSESQEE